MPGTCRRELGVRYVLEGSVRRAGDRIRVAAQLVEAETGMHDWAERYDRDLTDIFALQDEITQAVTIAVTPTIAGAEQRRAMRRPPETGLEPMSRTALMIMVIQPGAEPSGQSSRNGRATPLRSGCQTRSSQVREPSGKSG